MCHPVLLGPVAVILCKRPEVVKNPEVLVDYVLLGSTYILRGKDMQLLRALCNLQDELEQPDSGLARCRC